MAVPLRVPLSDAQHEVWLAAQFGDQANAAYNWTWLLRVRGVLRRDAVVAAVQALVDRHQALRTGIAAGGEYQVVHPRVAVDVPVVELASPVGLATVVAAAENRPFDLATAPLAAFQLVAVAPDEHVLVVTAHHVIADGFSLGVIFDDLAALLRGDELTAAGSFADHLRWRRSVERAHEIADAERYWADRFADGFPRLRLPTDLPPTLPAGGRLQLPVPRDTLAAARALGNRHGATLFTTLLAAFAAFLTRLTGQDDLVVGVSTAGRRFPQDAHLVAHCVNLLPVRLGPTRGTFEQWLTEVRDTVFDAQDNDQVPLARLLRHLGQVNTPSDPALPVSFNVETTRAPDLGPFDAELSTPGSSRGAPRALSVAFAVQGDGADLDVIYRADLLREGTVRAWMTAILTLLHAAVTDPSLPVADLPLLSEIDSRNTTVDYPSAGVHELFARQAADNPDAVAVVSNQDDLTYRDLDRRSSRMANHLVERGVRAEGVVGVHLGRSADLVIAFLAVLKAGAAYLPLDLAYPPERLSRLVADSGVEFVIAATDPPLPGVTWVPVDTPGTAELSVPLRSPDQLAYITYTSGSTGHPKGVMVPHRAVVRLLEPMSYAPIHPTDRVLVSSAIPFDVLTLELWGTLLRGATAVLSPDAPTVEALGRLLRDQRVTSAWFIASLFHQIVDTDPQLLAPLRQVLAGGEAVAARQVASVVNALPGLRVVNGYGPTECTTFATTWTAPNDFTGAEPVPLGGPIDNTTVYVLDPALRPLPAGIPGEIYIGGPGVARGYRGRAALTADKFLPDPFAGNGTRMYRTGDKARRRPDGLIEFLGRVDDQVKVRGYRIEPGEVSATLAAHPDVRQAVTVVHEDRLVSYVVVEREPEDLRAHAARTLPEHMVPSTVVVLPELPVTRTGKVDRAALPTPQWHSGGVAPRTDTERLLAGLWERTLGHSGIGVDDNLFSLGAHSLHILRVISQIAAETRVEVPLRVVFESPTIRAQSAYVDNESAQAKKARPSILDELDAMGIQR
ncbi:non-ribosomal peptide synthetase [Actinokineospora globicatena]|uniref:non-ribosomal peptide synthetase n=1 Tax=Actinokineospora globicatena TaxID=103729 RepID=UPI0020A5C880|nr:amino acid adenylation domain-containing protein [Actinokineospora globicatena]MCP2303060.1 amino acid adenylation domain-containing protein [Actinokineospora globicatena]GLW79828.1 hypothetical protein Aglo01_43090 [Actinokineospora globicatena]GLW85762.1 hypothetical protein Aglo02_34020 [Actinokineospora globicatena]